MRKPGKKGKTRVRDFGDSKKENKRKRERESLLANVTKKIAYTSFKIYKIMDSNI
jgi:hypothetical protein